MAKKSASTSNRRTVSFPSGDSFCMAWLYLPESSTEARPPIVVMGHGFGATRELGLAPYAERFVDAGLAVLVFTYRNLGDSGSGPRQVLSMPKQLADWDAAIAYAARLPEVDGGRMAIWGSSLGGGHAISVASRHPELRAAVSQCPFTDGRASAGALGPLQSLKLLSYVARDVLAAIQGRDPVCVPVAAAPGQLGFMTAPDALPGMMAIVPQDHTWINKAAARSMLSVLNYRPGKVAKCIEPPILICISKDDSVAPTATAERYARQAPRGDVRFYEAGHFAFYVGEPFKRLVADQTEFLVRHLQPGAQAAATSASS
jgi:dienelactone hydrolase